MSIITIKELSKKYKIDYKNGQYSRSLRDVFSFNRPVKGTKESDFFALKNITFSVEKGEKIGFIGSNGAGKSTLLKVISKIVYPSSGDVKINGRVGCLLEVGTGFHPELSGRENIFLNASILGMRKKEIKSKFDDIVEFAGVEKFIDMPVKKYSSGMYVRLAFSVAAHLDPEILIVDEVLAVGDSAFQKKCLGKMNEIAKDGRTVLFVSHNMHAVQNLCDRGLVFENGNLIYDGLIHDSISNYLKSKAIIKTQKKFSVNTDSDCSLISCTILNKNQDSCSFNVGERINIEAVIFINSIIDDFVIAFGVNSISNYPINTSWSRPEKMGKGFYTVKFSITSFVLASGNYTICIGASSGGRSLFYFENIIDFEVNDLLDASFSPENIKSIYNNSGVILNQNSIMIDKQD